MPKKIGLWVYRNDGGDVIHARVKALLERAGHEVVTDFDMRRCYWRDGRVFTEDHRDLSSLSAFYHMNADEQTPYQNEMVRLLELSGVAVVNGWAAFSRAKDKLTANALLRRAGVDVPPALFVGRHATRAFVESAFERWPGGVVVKPRQNHGAVGITKYDSAEALWDFVLATREAFDSYYIEKFIEFGEHDCRVEIFDGEVVGGYGRLRTHRFKTNVSSGGKMMPLAPGEEHVALALRAARALGIETTIVDMIRSAEDQKLYVLEVNPIMGVFVEAGMRAGQKMPACEPDVAYSYDERKIQLLAAYLDGRANGAGAKAAGGGPCLAEKFFSTSRPPPRARRRAPCARARPLKTRGSCRSTSCDRSWIRSTPRSSERSIWAAAASRRFTRSCPSCSTP